MKTPDRRDTTAPRTDPWSAMHSRIEKYVFDVSTLPLDAALAWRLEGWRGVWAEIRQRTLFRVFRGERFLVTAEDVSSFQPCPAPPGVRIGRVEPEEWVRMGEIMGRRRLARYERIAARGRVCFAAWRGDAPIGYTWISDRTEPDVEGCSLPLAPDAAYLWNLYVIPKERGNGVGSALVSALREHARDTGFRTGWRMISPRNIASLRTLEKTAGASARVIARLRYRKWLNRSRFEFEPVADADAADVPSPASA